MKTSFAPGVARAASMSAMFSVLSLAAADGMAQATSGTLVLTGADRRPATSLNGEWASIVDPYFAGLFSFHHEEKKNGWFLNSKGKAR